jgi:hypothetical protein
MTKRVKKVSDRVHRRLMRRAKQRELIAVAGLAPIDFPDKVERRQRLREAFSKLGFDVRPEA